MDMDTLSVLRERLAAGGLDARLGEIYGCAGGELARTRARLLRLADEYGARFGETEAGFFSGPGRTELGGNHTDHQRGCVLAGAVSLDAAACAGKNGGGVIRIRSEGYPETAVALDSLAPRPEERETTAALVRGMAARAAALGYEIGGFDAVVSSDVPGGSGLSSSAAFEVLTGVILNELFCGGALGPVAIAQAGQFAENEYFGKPSGLMDQLASAVGGAAAMDFRDPDAPRAEKLNVDFEAAGYALCVVDSGADHAGLTGEYAAVPAEMRAVAALFGKEVLRQVDEADFWRELPRVRAEAGDRAALRAMHFFADNGFARREAQALKDGDIAAYLALVRRSGLSSATRLENLYCPARPREQAIPVALAAAEHLLGGEGAVRVHGGGFAGTIQAYVPLGMKEAFRTGMEAALGRGCCRWLRIRPAGGVRIG